jgi:hypothetical protein
MGAERMAVMHWLAGVLWWNFGYRPRHRSTRQDTDEQWTDDPWSGRPEISDVLDHFDGDQVRQLLEGCALEDVTRIIRPLVRTIAHSSHTATSLASAWTEFARFTREAHALHFGTSLWSDYFQRDELGTYPAEDAVERKLRDADHAWRLLTDGAR